MQKNASGGREGVSGCESRVNAELRTHFTKYSSAHIILVGWEKPCADEGTRKGSGTREGFAARRLPKTSGD
jgi:hypothetical protein